MGGQGECMKKRHGAAGLAGCSPLIAWMLAVNRGRGSGSAWKLLRLSPTGKGTVPNRNRPRLFSLDQAGARMGWPELGAPLPAVGRRDYPGRVCGWEKPSTAHAAGSPGRAGPPAEPASSWRGKVLRRRGRQPRETSGGGFPRPSGRAGVLRGQVGWTATPSIVMDYGETSRVWVDGPRRVARSGPRPVPGSDVTAARAGARPEFPDVSFALQKPASIERQAPPHSSLSGWTTGGGGWGEAPA